MASRGRGRQFGRSGDGNVAPSSQRLPRAQEHVLLAPDEIDRQFQDFWPADPSLEAVYPEGMPRSPASRVPRFFHRMASTNAVQRRARWYGMAPAPTRLHRVPAKQLFMRAPSRVRFCVKRKERREVLFALRRAGYSGSARKRRWYRNASSQYRC